MMKRIVPVILAGILLLSLAGCRTPAQQSYTPTQQAPTTNPAALSVTPGESSSDYEGVQVRIDNLNGPDAEGDLSLVVTWENQTPYTVTYGAAYGIERLEFEGWGSCAKRDELAFIAIGYELSPGATKQQTYDLTNTYDVSSPGVYRFKATCYVHDRTDESTKCELVAEFTVGDAERPDAAWKEGTDLEYNAQFLRPQGYSMDAEFPSVAVINSLKELSQRCTISGETPPLGEDTPVPGGVGLPEDFSAYDAEFFQENYLIFLFLEEGSGSAWHEIRSVKQTRDNRISISIDSIYPEVCTADMARWYVVIELSREHPAESEQDVLLCRNGRLCWNGDAVDSPQPEAQFKNPPEGLFKTAVGESSMVVGGYTWSVKNPDGTTTTTVADAAGRPLPRESLVPICIPSQYAQTVYSPVPDPDNKVVYKPTNSLGYEIKPYWAGYPSQVTCTRWPDTVWQDSSVQGESIPFDWGNSHLYAPDGGYIYEFAVTWPEGDERYYGTAYYYLYIIGGEEHTHQTTPQAQTVDDPITGYCGNTWSTLQIGGKEYGFMGGNSVTLTDILVNLRYDPLQVCRCLPEYTANTEFGSGYGINLTDGYVRCEKGQADLTQAQIDAIAQIIEWAETTNCEYPT